MCANFHPGATLTLCLQSLVIPAGKGIESRRTPPSRGRLYAAASVGEGGRSTEESSQAAIERRCRGPAWRRLRRLRTRRCATLFDPFGEILRPPAAPRKTAISLDRLCQNCPILGPSSGPGIGISPYEISTCRCPDFGHSAPFWTFSLSTARLARQQARNTFFFKRLSDSAPCPSLAYDQVPKRTDSSQGSAGARRSVGSLFAGFRRRRRRPPLPGRGPRASTQGLRLRFRRTGPAAARINSSVAGSGIVGAAPGTLRPQLRFRAT